MPAPPTKHRGQGQGHGHKHLHQAAGRVRPAEESAESKAAQAAEAKNAFHNKAMQRRIYSETKKRISAMERQEEVEGTQAKGPLGKLMRAAKAVHASTHESHKVDFAMNVFACHHEEMQKMSATEKTAQQDFDAEVAKMWGEMLGSANKAADTAEMTKELQTDGQSTQAVTNVMEEVRAMTAQLNDMYESLIAGLSDPDSVRNQFAELKLQVQANTQKLGSEVMQARSELTECAGATLADIANVTTTVVEASKAAAKPAMMSAMAATRQAGKLKQKLLDKKKQKVAARFGKLQMMTKGVLSLGPKAANADLVEADAGLEALQQAARDALQAAQAAQETALKEAQTLWRQGFQAVRVTKQAKEGRRSLGPIQARQAAQEAKAVTAAQAAHDNLQAAQAALEAAFYEAQDLLQGAAESSQSWPVVRAVKAAQAARDALQAAQAAQVTALKEAQALWRQGEAEKDEAFRAVHAGQEAQAAKAAQTARDTLQAAQAALEAALLAAEALWRQGEDDEIETEEISQFDVQEPDNETLLAAQAAQEAALKEQQALWQKGAIVVTLEKNLADGLDGLEQMMKALGEAAAAHGIEGAFDEERRALDEINTANDLETSMMADAMEQGKDFRLALHHFRSYRPAMDWVSTAYVDFKSSKGEKPKVHTKFARWMDRVTPSLAGTPVPNLPEPEQREQQEELSQGEEDVDASWQLQAVPEDAKSQEMVKLPWISHGGRFKRRSGKSSLHDMAARPPVVRPGPSDRRGMRSLEEVLLVRHRQGLRSRCVSPSLALTWNVNYAVHEPAPSVRDCGPPHSFCRTFSGASKT